MMLRDIRRGKGISLARLAEMTGLTKGYLSKIERSENAPPVSTLQTLARALGVDFADLVPDSLRRTDTPSHGTKNLEIVRGDAKAIMQGGEGDYAYQPLVAITQHKYMCPVLMTVAKGSTRAYTHDSEEFGYMLTGRVSLRYEGQTHHFEAGDAFYLDSRIEHAFTNDDEDDAIILSVNYHYRRF